MLMSGHPTLATSFDQHFLASRGRLFVRRSGYHKGQSVDGGRLCSEEINYSIPTYDEMIRSMVNLMDKNEL